MVKNFKFFLVTQINSYFELMYDFYDQATQVGKGRLEVTPSSHIYILY
jgi:hypothetical protein